MPNKPPVFKSAELPNKTIVGTIYQNWDEFCLRVSNAGYSKIESWKVNGKTYDPRNILQDYYRKTTRQGVVVHYFHSKYTNSGRRFADGSCGLQSLSRPIRHTIAHNLYKDVDIENCHPVLLVQYCKSHNYECEHIESYIQNRDDYLKQLMSVNGLELTKDNREWAKKVLLSAVNGSMTEIPKCIQEMKVKPQWFDKFYQQCDNIKKIVSINPENSSALKIVKRKLKEVNKLNNVEGSLLNNILCELEDSVLMCAIDYCKKNGGNVRNYVLCFDGFMIPFHETIDFDELQKYVKFITGYDVKFNYKEMNEVIDLTGLSYTNLDESGSIVIENDLQGAEFLIEKLKEDILVSPTTIYMRDGYTWTNDEKRIDTLLKTKCMHLNLCHINASGAETSYSTNKRGYENIVSTSLLLLREKPDSSVEQLIFHSTLGKVCFKNGVYNFSTKTFTKWVDVRDVYTTIIIPYDYTPRDEAKIVEVYDKIFKSIFDGHEDEGKDLIGAIANALSGQIHQKYSVVGLGHRSGGKGVITDACRYAFGDYVQIFESGIFLMNGMEEVRRNAFLLDGANSRLLFCNEAKKDDTRKDCVYDGNLMKKIQGGDELEGRRIYEAPKKFRIQGKLFMMANDMPLFQPADCLQAVENYSFPYRFVPEFDEETSLAYHRKADPTIKDYIRKPEVSIALFHLLTDYYYAERSLSKASKAVCNDVLECCGDEETLFKLNFKIVPDNNDENEAVSSTEVKNWATRIKLNMSEYKIKKMLVDMGAVYHRQRRYNNKKISAFWGVIASFKKEDNSDDL